MSPLSPRWRSPLFVTGWLLTATLFAARLLPGLVQPGMFFDGVTHATIARNLAVGMGDVWHPVFSQADGAGYHEQPPLGFLLESFFFRVCGDHFWVEKLYSALTGLGTALLIAAVWRRLVGGDCPLLWSPRNKRGLSPSQHGRPSVGAAAGSGDPRRTGSGDPRRAGAGSGDPRRAPASDFGPPASNFRLPTSDAIRGLTARGSLIRRPTSDLRLRHLDWLPVALWIALPGWGWMFENNLLENTLGLFAVAAVYALLRADEGGRAKLIWLAAGAVAIAAAVLSKGPVGLYPLVTPLIAGLTLRRQRLSDAVTENAALGAFFFAALAFVGLLPGALEYFDKYLHEQLLASLQGHREIVSSVLGRFDILWKMSRELILPVAIGGGLIWWARRIARRVTAPLSDALIPKQNRAIAFCLLTGLSASLPIMASPKQSGHYAFPSYAFFALAIALWSAPAMIYLSMSATAEATTARWHRRLRYGATAVLVLLVAASCIMAGRPHKDKDAYLDAQVLGRLLPKASTIGLTADLATDYPLQTNLARWDFISADRATEGHEYLLAPVGATTAPPAAYVEVPAGMLRYRLFKRAAMVETQSEESATAIGTAGERTRSRN